MNQTELNSQNNGKAISRFPQISFEKQFINFYLNSEIIETRKINESDIKLFQTWIDSYRHALNINFKYKNKFNKDNSSFDEKKLKDQEKDILKTTGQDIYNWLNSSRSTLTQMFQKMSISSHKIPYVFEFSIPAQPDENELIFLEIPWEIIADNKGFLAGREGLAFCPVRRIGVQEKSDKPHPYWMSTLFMAAAPDGQVNLNFEYEEASILRAVEKIGTGIELIIEESGNIDGLEACAEAENNVDIIHISCHGGNMQEPVLYFEDDFGKAIEITAQKLASKLGKNKPKLLFLSACKTSDPDKFLNTCSSQMIRWGIPAVLGWGGSVSDNEATRFASYLYAKLSKSESITDSIAWSRLELIHPGPNIEPSYEWHLPRLYLGAKSCDVICEGKKPKRQRHSSRIYKEYLDKKGKNVPIASRYEFVGRRRQIQQILKAYKEKQYAGVLIHGIGRQGKSSLAARIANRMDRMKPVVIFGNYDAFYIFNTIKETLNLKQVNEIADTYKHKIQDDKKYLLNFLKEILNGPCQYYQEKDNDKEDKAKKSIFNFLSKKPKKQETDLKTPFLLIIDDFEQALEKPDNANIHKIKPELIESISAVIESFSNSETESKLLITSRYKFTLPHAFRDIDLIDNLFSLHLPPMQEYEGKKQVFAKTRVLLNQNKLLIYDEWRIKRLIEAARGNPGLQDLLFLMCIENPQAVDNAIDSIEEYIKRGKGLSEEKLIKFIQNLAIDEILKLLTNDENALLRLSTYFEMPVPHKIFELLSKEFSIKCGEPAGIRLSSLGLWEHFIDPVMNTGNAVCINGLIRGQAGEVSEQESILIADTALEPLFKEWGGEKKSKPDNASWELAKMSLLIEKSSILSLTARWALDWLESQYRNKEAVIFAINCVKIFDKYQEKVSPWFYVIASRLLKQSGKIKDAEDLLQRANQAFDKSEDKRSRAITLGDIARIKVDRGEVDEALKLHLEMIRVFEELGDKRSRAVYLGDIARIKVSRGEVDEALKLHLEELKVYEELGDQRSRAVTLGDIARIKVSRGEVDEALKLHLERIRVFEELGDQRSRAVTLGDIARIKVSRGEVDEALKLHLEMIRVFEELGDQRSRAVTLGDIARIKVSRGEVDEALKLHLERLKIAEEMEDKDNIANTYWDLAQIELQQKLFQEAFEHLNKSYKLNIEIGRLDGICFVGVTYGQLLCQSGNTEQGLIILKRSKDGFIKLGQIDYARQIENLINHFS